jgi:N4-(beta-N-acetylglucosaminyl)-L-asparaginase
MIAIQANGSISCGTTTNGASHKVPGRVGDSPIVGSGAYCESAVGGAAGVPYIHISVARHYAAFRSQFRHTNAATGDGDFMMRFSPAFAAVNLMRTCVGGCRSTNEHFTLVCSGVDPTSACAQALAPIGRYYPHVQVARASLGISSSS